MSREHLIELCEKAVVHHTKWSDRDSYCAQMSVASIYKGLTAGLDFVVVTKEICPNYHSDENTLIIRFKSPIDHEKLLKGKELKISSREDYFRDCDPEYTTEMFDGEGIDFRSRYTQTYMPTEKSLLRCKGNDWY